MKKQDKIKVVFFNNPQNEKSLAFTVINPDSEFQTVAELIENEIIPTNSPTLVKEIDSFENLPIEEYLSIHHCEYMQWDSVKNPTKLVLNSKIAAADHADILKIERNRVLEQLDSLQIRYLSQGKQDVVAEIEKDKQVLRDMPAKLNFKKVDKIYDLYNMFPACLLADYEDKYKTM